MWDILYRGYVLSTDQMAEYGMTEKVIPSNVSLGFSQGLFVDHCNYLHYPWECCKPCQGPLLQIYGFHPGCIRWCTMHALNLGILFTVNGGGLKLVPSVPGWKF